MSNYVAHKILLKLTVCINKISICLLQEFGKFAISSLNVWLLVDLGKKIHVELYG